MPVDEMAYLRKNLPPSDDSRPSHAITAHNGEQTTQSCLKEVSQVSQTNFNPDVFGDIMSPFRDPADEDMFCQINNWDGTLLNFPATDNFTFV